MYITVLLLCACTAYTGAMVCLPNYCDTVLCAPVHNCNGLVKPGTSFCGCCDTCLAQLGEGDSCWRTMNIGVPPTSECGAGLKCDSQTVKCVRTVTDGPCLTRLHQIQASQQNGMPLIGVTEPKCDSTGHYAPVQCIGSVCQCVDKMGQQLQTYQDSIGNLASMDCQCAQDQAAYMKTGLLGKLFYCDSNGNYRQTAGNNVQTEAMTGRQAATRITRPCAQAKLAQQVSAPLLGRPTVECDYDGYYTPRQCAGSEGITGFNSRVEEANYIDEGQTRCYCVRKDGTKIGMYSAPISQKLQTTCQCARDKARYASMGVLGVIHTCMSNGNYQQYQCNGSGCFCVDYSGQQVGNMTVSIADLDKIIC